MAVGVLAVVSVGCSSGAGLDDHFYNLYYRDASANWQLWGGHLCDNTESVPPGFFVNQISGHEYTTGDGSGFC